MPRQLLAIAFLLSLCACKQDPPRHSKPADTPPITPVFLDTPTPAPLHRPDAPSTRDDDDKKPEADDIREDRTRILALLDQGRQHVKSSDYSAGIASYQEALRIDPNHPRLLSELGWAAFKAGDLELAERATQHSVRHATSASVKGASLYNLGRIAEARKQPELALAHYLDSLQARPDNATVTTYANALRERGVELLARPECAFTRHDTPLDHKLSPFELCQHFTDHAENMCSEHQPSNPPLDIGPYTLRLFSTEPGDFDHGSRYLYLAVMEKTQWHTSLIGIEYNPGMGYIHDNLDVSKMRPRALFPDTLHPQVLVTLERRYTDGDYPRNEAVHIDMQTESVLDLEGTSPRWIASALVHREHAFDYMLEEANDGIDHGPDFPRSTTTRYEVKWGEEAYTTLPVEGTEDGEAERAVTHSYERPLTLCPQEIELRY